MSKMAVVIQFVTDMASPSDRFNQISEFVEQNLTQATTNLIYVIPENAEIDLNMHVDSRWSE